MQFCDNILLSIKVLWLGQDTSEASWESAENIPPEVIQEFEIENQCVATNSTVSRMGPHISTTPKAVASTDTSYQRQHQRVSDSVYVRKVDFFKGIKHSWKLT